MANFYKDTPELRAQLEHKMVERICELKERNFRDQNEFDYAPVDFADALDSYDKVLEIVGEICGDVIAPNAEGVDHEGPSVKDGKVIYATGTQQNLDMVTKAGLMGLAMPRRYGGLNFPMVAFVAAAEMVNRADAGFGNLWSLQDCAETLYEFGTPEQHQKYLPRICNGETMSMDLTEPDAGSDLQSVMLKATYNAEEDAWYLNGVKRFITNGDADIHLVLARSEDGSKDGRGLSMFIYDKQQGGVIVRRIENKMGIKGSPTCELVYKNAKAELCGSRRLGLIKYVMALMNGARLGIAAQSVGISQAAYNEALAYAKERKQFGKAIIEFQAVGDMLNTMKAKLDASRSLLYQTARFVDIYKILEDTSRERTLTPEEKAEMKKFSKLADSLTPLAKGLGSEYANQNAYDSIQVHGGSGFMKEYTCERLYRDARIASIYEGTTQLQVVAAIRYVTNGSYLEQIKNHNEVIASLVAESCSVESCSAESCSVENSQAAELNAQVEVLKSLAADYEKAVAAVLADGTQEHLDLMSRRLVELAGNLIMAQLLLQDALSFPDLYMQSAKYYIRMIKGESAKHLAYIG